jgi:glycosyltransferase involved in cell wall biosynthesis
MGIALARLAQGKHRISLLLNGAFANTVDPIRAVFSPWVAPQDIHVWQPLTPCAAASSDNAWRRKASEALYASFVRSLRADVLFITSLFEGHGDDVVCALPEGADAPLSAVTLHDLIPYLYPKPYLENRSVSAWYHRCLSQLRRADLLLAVSASSAQEAIDHLGSDPARTVNTSSAIEPRFRVLDLAPERATQVRARYGLQRPFVMYTGAAIEHRKNIEGLIAAYAALPKSLRAQHQLVIVCSIDEGNRSRLARLTKEYGLGQDELVLTGFVPDDDLLVLYNLCHLFVFPSWHEGFGLPVLEAMTCGAPTLASNCSSLPEVVGWDDALFDPFDRRSMTQAIERGLTDAAFHAALKAHGLRQAQKFSWEATAQRALDAIEAAYARRESAQQAATEPATALPRHRRPRLAYVSPLPSARSGIADYSAELLPVLAEYYDIEVIVEQVESLTGPGVLANLPVRSVAWFEQHAHRFDRILYHFGNSHYHQHMFALLERHPGAVVLHDFFLSGVRAYMDATGYAPGAWARSLLHAHGWEALQHRYEAEDANEVIWRWPCNLEVLQQAWGVIVHAEFSRQLAERWYGQGFADDWAVIPLLRSPVALKRQQARQALGLGEEDILVCSFGLLGQTKLNHTLVEAWLTSSLARDPRCQLVFVGQASGEYGQAIQQQIRAGQGRIRITSWADEATYRTYLAAADIAVQLCTLSHGETSAAVLDCMNHGVPTIINAHGAMAELPRDAVWMLDDAFATADLVAALETLRADPERRAALGHRARAHIRTHHQPRICARQYAEAIERFYAQAERGTLGLARRLQRIGPPSDPRDLGRLAERVVELMPPRRPAQRQLLIDISGLHQGDLKGMHRVVRNVLYVLLKSPPEGFRVEPVYATPEHSYRYARRFTARFLGLGEVPLEDTPVLAQPGDVFWGLDLQSVIVPTRQSDLAWMRLRGVKVVFTVYDLLPILLPETFGPGAAEGHRRWLDALTQAADGLLAISAKVSGDLKVWLNLFGPQEGHPIQLGWAHLGADVDEQRDDKSRRRLAPHEERLLAVIRRYPAFLMVGTVEPRKGHAQALAAFELLWSRGEQVNLVIVGKQGWLVDDLVARLRSHPLRDRHLFWLEGIDDVLLEQVYAASTCLLAASLDEGFGLPVVEAARHKLPILARDIAVFREVAGEHATYFTGHSPQALAAAISDWLQQKQKGTHIRSDAMPWLDWEQSTRAMLDIILSDKWQDVWTPARDDGLIARYWGSDPRLSSVVGERKGTAIWSTGRAGHVLYGPYMNLKPGHYQVTIQGRIGPIGANGATSDVCIEGGTKVLARGMLRENGETLASLEFSIATPCTGLETRVYVEPFSDVCVDMVEIRRLSHTPRQIALENDQPEDPLPSANQLRLSYWATHPDLYTQVGYAVGRSLYTRGQAGYLVYGPSAPLPAGNYVARIVGVVNEVGSAWIDITWDKGEQQIAEQPLKVSRGELIIPFTITSYVSDLEIRLYVDEDTDMQLDALIVEEETK